LLQNREFGLAFAENLQVVQQDYNRAQTNQDAQPLAPRTFSTWRFHSYIDLYQALSIPKLRWFLLDLILFLINSLMKHQRCKCGSTAGRSANG
jgi:hypothetical protein